MKTAQQIIGLPVVSIFDGNEIGKVKNVIINASKGTIDFFIIDSGIRSLAGGVIPAERVLGIGEYALTIQQPDDISDIVKIPAAIELMQKNITVRGTRVLTRKGSLLGEAGDIYINEEESYNIIGVEFVPANSSVSTGIIPRSSIITFGKNLLVVQDDFIDRLIETPGEIQKNGDEKKNNAVETQIMDSPAPETIPPLPVAPLTEATAPAPEEAASHEEVNDELLKLDDFNPDYGNIKQEEAQVQPQPSYQEPDLSITSETVQPASAKESQPSAAELFEQRQRQYLAGKRATKAIYDSSGKMIVNAGETITEEIIMEVKANGKLIELVMNYEE